MVSTLRNTDRLWSVAALGGKAASGVAKTLMRPLGIGVVAAVAAGHSVTTNFLCTVCVRFAAAARFKSSCKSCVSQVQFAASQIPTPYGHKYRLFMGSDTDRLWSARVEHTDTFWSVLPIGYG
jgi:hypothetical protein